MGGYIEFEQTNNTRDLGGLKCTDGAIKDGLLFRSGHLGLCSDTDILRLSELIDVVIDLRTDKECEEKPDRSIPGCTYIHMPLFRSFAGGITREKDTDQTVVQDAVSNLSAPGAARKKMMGNYRLMATDEGRVAQCAKFLDFLLNCGDEAVLWHCTAGKDRAGIASFLIEKILGLPDDDLMADYLETNKYAEGEIQIALQEIDADEAKEEALRDLFSAREEYLKSYIMSVNELYGSMENFIENRLGVDAEKRNALKAKYLK